MAMAYDSGRQRTVVVGGFDGIGAIGDTWELGGSAATYRTFGTGCIGSNGLWPRLVPGALPALGTTTTLGIADLPSGGGTVYLTLGLSDTMWGSSPLPFDLAVTGLTGCRAYTSADAGVFLTHASGTATFSLAIPATPALSGFVLFAQALSFDAAVTRPFPGAVSNAAEMNLR